MEVRERLIVCQSLGPRAWPGTMVCLQSVRTEERSSGGASVQHQCPPLSCPEPRAGRRGGVSAEWEVQELCNKKKVASEAITSLQASISSSVKCG